MNYANRRPIPTSVVRLSNSTIATYDNSAFLALNAGLYRRFPQAAREASRGRRLLMVAAGAALLVIIFLLGVAAAQADPVSLANQATIVRFTNKVEFGAARGENAQAKINAGFAHFLVSRNGTSSRSEAVAKAKRVRESAVKQAVQTAHMTP